MDETSSPEKPRSRSELQEIRRQVGNSYAMLRSIIRWSAESAARLDSYAWHLEGRLDVIGRIVLAVMREPGTSFELGSLIEDELNDQGASHGANALSLSGPPVALDATAAEVLGLLFYELVANSIEHGVLGMDEGGELRVSWRVEPAGDDAGTGDTLRLDWVERGMPARLAREGFGSMVLDGMLRYQLDGRAERAFGPDGARISIAVPMRNLNHEEGLPPAF